MGMRSSDAQFLRREVVPILQRAEALSPEAAEVLGRLRERLAAGGREGPTAWQMEREHRVYTEENKPVGWTGTLLVDDQTIPYLRAYEDDDGWFSLILDRRFGMADRVEADELDRWLPFMANAMAVSAGRTSHGPNSYVRNPHGRSGAGDPPELLGEPIEMTGEVMEYRPRLDPEDIDAIARAVAVRPTKREWTNGPDVMEARAEGLTTGRAHGCLPGCVVEVGPHEGPCLLPLATAGGGTIMATAEPEGGWWDRFEQDATRTARETRAGE